MVSGLVTSQCDQLRIFSGEARLMRMASKSAIVFCISNGLERNKVFLRFLLSGQWPVVGDQWPVFMFRGGREALPHETFLQKFFVAPASGRLSRGRHAPGAAETAALRYSAAALAAGFFF